MMASCLVTPSQDDENSNSSANNNNYRHRRGTPLKSKLPHEEQLLSSSGRRFWSRRRVDGGPELRPLPAFGVASVDNPRSRLLFTKTGHDSFRMIGNSTLNYREDGDHDALYGIGINRDNESQSRNNQPQKKEKFSPEHPHNHKHSKSDKGKGYPIRPSRQPVLAPSRSPASTSRPTNANPPSIRPPSFPPPSGNNSGGGGGGSGNNGGGGGGNNLCESPIQIQFLQFSAIPPAIFVFPQDPNVQDMGTRYIYNSDLRDSQSLDELIGSSCSGVCTRTQSRIEDISGAVFQRGGGHCTFTYVINDGNDEFTLEASGTVADSLGGTLSITGGTKDTIGAFGQIALRPVNLTPQEDFEREDGDFFLDPLFYLADAVVFVPC